MLVDIARDQLAPLARNLLDFDPQHVQYIAIAPVYQQSSGIETFQGHELDRKRRKFPQGRFVAGQ